MNQTKERQNQPQIDMYNEKGPVQLGPWSSHIYRSDPRHLLFVLSRYKFVAKLLADKDHVLEIGCGDGIGLPVVLQSVKKITAVDIEPLVITDIQKRIDSDVLDRCDVRIVNLVTTPLEGVYDAAYSLDVIEHIEPANECSFLTNIVKSLKPEGFLVIGTPNVSADQYASPYSREGHINLKSAETLKISLGNFFHHVFIFSMNDEMVHTGYYPMAHYLFALGVDQKNK